METVPLKSTDVNPSSARFRRNVSQVRRAGYNLRFTAAMVYANGHPVDRELFERCHVISLLALLDDHIGRKARALEV